MPAYGGPSDALLEALSQAEAQPSRAYRAVSAGADAGKDILGGYMAGKGIQQQLQQYKTLNTRLGDVFPPDSIPGGLTPDHTVGQLMQLAPILPYTRSPMADVIGNELAGNAPTGQVPSPSVPPPPSGSSGPTQLASLQGTGGTPQPNIGPSASPTTPAPPTGGAPFKGMSYMDLQRYGPFLNDIRQGRQFQEGQANENQRAQLSRDQQHQQFLDAQAAEESRFGRGHMATAAGEAAKNLGTTGTIQDDINTLRGLYKGYEPPAFIGGIGSAISAASGKPNYGTPWMQQGNQIGQVTPALGAKINYELTRRFSPGESQLLMKYVAPSPTDDEVNANRKLNNLQRLTSVFQSSDLNQISMTASAIAGQPIHAIIPTSGSVSTQPPPNSIHQTAIQWAQANPNDPRSKAVLAKAMAMSGGQ
jgi:hypothetical protein